MKKRCPWVPLEKDFYVEYHDTEWGVPLHDDHKIFEFLTLESAQAGLSWETILKKRDGYRKNFKNFDPKKVAKLTEKDVERMLQDSSIIRNRAKIESAINNAKKFLEIREEFGTFDTYMWSFVGGKPIQNNIKKIEDYSATTKESDVFAKDLKKRGFKFLGPTTVYAHMQASGMVNDHSVDCFRRKEVQKYT
tara:strand:- start:205692 stop:206267 length:576 start_codon:yes stop_codon:yes gene_type:complete